jgi:formate hydrogenlyase subunit 4
MIIPRNRLLYFFALIVLPFVIIGTIFPEVVDLSAGIILLFVIIIVIDAFLARLRFDGITVEFPGVVRLSRNKKGNIEVRIKNAKE